MLSFCQNQSTVASFHVQEDNLQKHANITNAGILWGDEDFNMIKLDPLCLPLDVASEDEVKRRTK